MNTLKTRAVAFVAVCAMASGCETATETTNVTASPAGHFQFHIDPWMSLHHFAYHFVREEEQSLKLRGDVPLAEDDRDAISAEFRSACASLNTAYRPYIEGSLLHDASTRGLTRELWNGPEALSDSAVRDALSACMPVYELTHWPSHRAVSQAFLEELTTQLEMHESAMADALADALESAWSDAPIRVDISPYANWAGAYTDDLPPSITISSFDETVSTYAFEILFHEAAHTGAFGASLDAAANTALDAVGMENNRFWHYILFFVTGKTVSDVFDDPDYLPYSRAAGLTESPSASVFYKALDESWDLGDSFYERVLIAAEMVAAEQGQQ